MNDETRNGERFVFQTVEGGREPVFRLFCLDFRPLAFDDEADGACSENL